VREIATEELGSVPVLSKKKNVPDLSQTGHTLREKLLTTLDYTVLREKLWATCRFGLK